MTTRRRQSSDSGQPGSRAWRNSIERIKQELNAHSGRLIGKLEEQDAENAEEVKALTDSAKSLRVEELLSYMNDTLLDGQGVVQTYFRWEEGQALDEDDEYEDDDDDEEYDDEEDDDDDDDDEFELFVVLTVALSWKDGGRLQIKVDIQEEDGEIEMNVNGREVSKTTSGNLQSVLLQAFREQMDPEYGADE